MILRGAMNMANMAGKDIPPPVMDDAGTDYEDYKIRVDKWCRITKHAEEDKADILQLVMGKKAFGITKRIPREVLKSADGVKELLKKLDEHFIPDKLQHTMNVWDKFISIKRNHKETMIDHIQRFMDAFENFQDIDTRLECPDPIVAMLLLTSCNLKEEDSKIVKAQMEEPPASKNLIGILKRVMTADKTDKEAESETEIYKTYSSDTQVENSSDRATTSTALYSQDNRRDRPARRGRIERTDPWRPVGPKRNAIGPDGDYSRCHFCESSWHYVNGCPEMRRLKRECRNIKDDKDDKDFDRDRDRDRARKVHLSI